MCLTKPTEGILSMSFLKPVIYTTPNKLRKYLRLIYCSLQLNALKRIKMFSSQNSLASKRGQIHVDFPHGIAQVFVNVLLLRRTQLIPVNIQLQTRSQMLSKFSWNFTIDRIAAVSCAFRNTEKWDFFFYSRPCKNTSFLLSFFGCSLKIAFSWIVM